MMEYRKLGRTGLDVGVIGLGTEHLELRRETMEGVLRMAAEAGANCIDLLYIDAEGSDAGFWAGFGPVLRLNRDKFVLAAHWGSGPRYDMEYCQHCFEDVLSRVGNEHVEIGLMTMVDDEDKWNGWAQEFLEHLRHCQEKGCVGHIGMSTHEVPIALKAVHGGLIDVLMFGVNLVGHADEAHNALYRACTDLGVGLVAMKPYFGGTLLSVDGKATTITPIQCLAYVLSQPISTTVPGVRNAQELSAALQYLQATDEGKDYRLALNSMYRDLAGHCVYCNHCLPCPQGIAIGWTILLADWAQGGASDELSSAYAALKTKASACRECGVCVERCPFDVDIIAKMRRTVEVFETRVA